MAWQRLQPKFGSKSAWYGALFNLLALCVLVYVLTQGSRDWQQTDTFDAMLASGKWAVRFLLLCLTMTPLHLFLCWSGALKLRKPAGLWAFGFAMLHMAQYAIETWEPDRSYRVSGVLWNSPWPWLVWPMQLYIVLGLVGMALLAALAVTSNRWSMQRLGKNWKRLHRLVYPAGVVVILHALLATTMSKKVMVYDPQAVAELRIYLGLLVVLLVVRIPQVRSLLQQRVARLRPQARAAQPVAPSVLSGQTPTQLPKPRPLAPLPSPRHQPAIPSQPFSLPSPEPSVQASEQEKMLEKV